MRGEVGMQSGGPGCFFWLLGPEPVTRVNGGWPSSELPTVVVLAAAWFSARCVSVEGGQLHKLFDWVLLVLAWRGGGGSGPDRLSSVTWPGLVMHADGGRSLHGLPKAVALAIVW